MKNRSILHPSALFTSSFTVAVTALLLAHSAQAANGTWSANVDGTWSTTVATTPPWVGGIVASGSGFTANFANVNITADRVVTLGEPIMIGTMIFGDTDSTFGMGWTVANGGVPANILTLAGTTPTISVTTLNGDSATISAAVTGTEGLTKTGSGTAVLSGLISLSGGVTVSAGSLTLNGTAGSSIAGPISNAGTLTVGDNTTISGSSPFVQRGASAATSLSGDKSAYSGALTINGGYLNATNTANTDFLQALGTGTITFAGSSTVRLIANSSTTGTQATEVVVGNDVVVAGPIGSTSTLIARRASGSGSNKILLLDTLSTGGGQTLTTLGRDGYSIRFTGATTLVDDAFLSPASANLTLAGAIGDGSAGKGLAKTGTGTLFLTGTNTYSGPTTNFGGILEANEAVSLPTNSNLRLDGGVLQTTNLTTFDRALGTGADQVKFGLNGGGFAARTADLTVNLGGSGSTLVWGSTANFLVNGAALILGSSTADKLVDFQNPIDLNGAVRAVTVNGTVSTALNRISGVISNSGGAASLLKNGAGVLRLSGTNTYTGTTNVNAGTLMLEAASTGSLDSSSDLTFSGTGVFDYNNTAADGARSQILDALAFSSGDGTAQATRVAAQDLSLSLTSLATRATGATGNFVVSGGTNGISNKIVLGGVTTGFMDRGYFFGGSNYAYYDGAGFVRGVNWGVDSNSATQAGGASVASSTYAQTTNSVTAQQAATFTGLNIANATNTVRDFTLDTGVTVTTNGILVTGGTGTTASTTLSGGTGIRAASGEEMVIRTHDANDRLTISTPILADGSNSLTKSGAGTLTLRAANGYTGTTYVNAGTLTLSGIVPVSTTVIPGNIEINGGTLTNNTSNATNAIATTSNIILNAGTYQQNRLDAPVGTFQTLANFTQNGGTATVSSAGQAQCLMTVTGTTTLNGGTWTVGIGGQNGSAWSTAAMKITGGVNTIGVGGNNGGTTQQLTVSGGLQIDQPATGPFTALTIANNAAGSATVSTQMLLSGGGLTYTPNANNPYPTTIASVIFLQGNSLPGIALTGTQTFNIGGHTGSSTPDLIIQPNITTGGIDKAGLGMLVLEGSNFYTGATTVSAGTLRIMGSTATTSAVTVNANGTLGGTGTVGGTVTGAGTIAPGASVGTLTTGAVTLTGTLAIEVDGANADKLLSTGAVNLTGATLTVAELGTFVGPYVIAQGTSVTGTMTVPPGYVVDISSGTQAILTKTGGSETYAAWLGTKFSAGELLDPAISGPQADPDSDGMGNLLEFVVGTEPKTAEQGKGPDYTTPGGIPTITLEAKTTSLSQATVTGKSGINLITWPDAMTLSSSTAETPIAGYTTLVFTGTVAGEKRFYRLEIVSPTP